MSRRIRLLFSPALALLLVASGLGPGVNSSASRPDQKRTLPQGAVPGKQRPNFVLIVTDDQRWDTLSYMPKLQEYLGRGGITFTNAFVTTPVCCPSRASILTGQYAHNTGVHPPHGGARHFKDASTLATWLQSAGYRTALIGKYLNGYEKLGTYIPPGWDVWEALLASRGRPFYYDYELNENGKVTRYGSKPAEYSTDVYTRKAVAFIRSSGKQPFFLYLAFTAPHGPPIPADRHQAMPIADVWRPPSYNELDVSDKPARVQNRPALSRSAMEKLDNFRADQLRALQAVDEAIGTILAVLGATGKSNNTLVLFTSDNGYVWGEHRAKGKRLAYEESIRVPFLVSYPKGIKKPGRDDRMVLNIDIAPSLAELAGVVPPTKVNGRSILPLLEGTAAGWRTDFLLEHWQRKKNDIVPTFAGVRTQQWKYVESVDGEKELYDLSTDPSELQNLANQPQHSFVQRKLIRRLQQLKRD